MSDNKDTTVIQEVELDLDNLLGTPGADNIMIPEKKSTIFSRKPIDLSDLDKPDKKDDKADSAADNKKSDDEKDKDDGQTKKKEPEVITDEDIDNINSDEKDGKGGRPKVDKEGLIELANKLIEKKLMVPFDDDKPLEKYTLQDFEELFEANVQDREKKIRDSIPVEFFDSLPTELQYAAKYVADGGQDIKGLFRSLAASEEIKELDPTSERDQEQIVKSYLQATNFGTQEDIDEEVNSWKDRNELEAKAQKFKPKLDAMQEQVVARKLKQQEHIRKQQQAQAQSYMENIYKTLEPAEVNGLKLDKKTQSMLYSGLVQPNYPSVSGKSTNLLGHLLEKYQFVEPNHGLIAEALWLLADPDGYKAKIKETAKKEVVTDTVRKLKSEEASRTSSTAVDDDVENNQRKTGKLPRPTQSFFKR